jgi:hypothetical protein
VCIFAEKKKIKKTTLKITLTLGVASLQVGFVKHKFIAVPALVAKVPLVVHHEKEGVLFEHSRHLLKKGVSHVFSKKVLRGGGGQ